MRNADSIILDQGTVTRYLSETIVKEALAGRKMAFISGPRQSGKTTMAFGLLSSEANRFSWDDSAYRRRWAKDPVESVSGRGDGPILLDEIHKDRRWKSRLKGLYDVCGSEAPILATGSAMLDLVGSGGDSLKGRYIAFRLHPFSVGERPEPPPPEEILVNSVSSFPFADMLKLGTFPEPLLAGSEAKAGRWSRLRLERLLYEDLRDLRHVHDLQALRVLADLLPERVGSLFSINSLRGDVGVAYATVRDWIGVLEALYHVILVRPHAGKLRRTLKAEPKLYLYDTLEIDDPRARRENLTALHLLKACQYWTDLAWGDFELRYVRTKEKEEVDFAVIRDSKPWMLVECESSELSPSPTLIKFAGKFATSLNFQLVDKKGYDREYPQHDVRVIDYERFLAGLV